MLLENSPPSLASTWSQIFPIPQFLDGLYIKFFQKRFPLPPGNLPLVRVRHRDLRILAINAQAAELLGNTYRYFYEIPFFQVTVDDCMRVGEAIDNLKAGLAFHEELTLPHEVGKRHGALNHLINARSLLFHSTPGKKWSQLSIEDLTLSRFRDPRIPEAFNATHGEHCHQALINMKGPHVLVFLDIDEFKAINTEYSHPGGDLALSKFAQTVVTQLRKGDLFVRYGGDECYIVIEQPKAIQDSGSDASHIFFDEVKSRICSLSRALKHNPVVFPDGRVLYLTISAGFEYMQDFSTGLTAVEVQQSASHKMTREKVRKKSKRRVEKGTGTVADLHRARA